MRKVFCTLHNLHPGNREVAGGLHNFQPFFQPDYPHPSVKFPAARRQLCPEGVTHFFVEPAGACIFRRHNGVQHPVALLSENPLQGFIEPPGDAGACRLGPQIDGRLCAPAVGRPLKGGAGVGVAQDFAALLPDQPGKLGGDVPEPLPECLPAGDGVFKRNGGIGDIRCAGSG